MSLLALCVASKVLVGEFRAVTGCCYMKGVSADMDQRATGQADCLQCAFDEIDKRWGSVHAYLEGPFGLDQQARERLIARLLVRR